MSEVGAAERNGGCASAHRADPNGLTGTDGHAGGIRGFNRFYRDLAAERVNVGFSRRVDLDAELRPQVDHLGKRSNDRKTDRLPGHLGYQPAAFQPQAIRRLGMHHRGSLDEHAGAFAKRDLGDA